MDVEEAGDVVVVVVVEEEFWDLVRAAHEAKDVQERQLLEWDVSRSLQKREKNARFAIGTQNYAFGKLLWLLRCGCCRGRWRVLLCRCSVGHDFCD